MTQAPMVLDWLCFGERLLVGIGVDRGREDVRHSHRGIVIFETAEQFIEQLLRGPARSCRWSWTEIDEFPLLRECQDFFEFFDSIHC